MLLSKFGSNPESGNILCSFKKIKGSIGICKKSNQKILHHENHPTAIYNQQHDHQE